MKDISIVISGAAGQGIQTVEQFLVGIFKVSGYNVFATKEYESRVRGGINSTEIRISSEKVAAFVDRIDILIVLNKKAYKHLEHRITENTVILTDPSNADEENKKKYSKLQIIDLISIAKDIGNKIYSNVVAVGVIGGLFTISKDSSNEYIKDRFSDKGDKVIEENYQSFLKGYEIGEKMKENFNFPIDLKPSEQVKEEILFNGNQGVALGAIAGGCNFISAYPMSPSTGVLMTLAEYSKEFEILVDQAEDEIAAINKTLGAWYAGARAIASTSGGGFALMVEGISLAGMTETPAVIHLAERPGPATGLPTRTAQEDLNFALYAGHGEFHKIMYAPGTIEEAFYLTQKAFNLADKLQSLVVILTDQYFVDSYYNVPNLDLSKLENQNHIIKTDENYKRYKLTDNGISPRGIPGYGDGLIRVDSDEHTESGFITEDLRDTRPKMIQKRVVKKLQEIEKHVLEPTLVGNSNYEVLIVCWGSSFHAAKEALSELGNDKVSLLHFSQVYPIHKKTKELLNKAKFVLILEGNATGQFANLLKLHADYEIPKENKFLKSNGEPFSVEEVLKFVKKQTEGI